MKKSFLAHHLQTFFRITAALAFVAFVGICLWVFEFTKAASFPAWVHAIWTIINIILTLFVLVHLVLYFVETNDGEAIGAGLGISLFILIGAGACIGLNGIGIMSTALCLILSGMAIGDMAWHFDSKQPEEVKPEEMKGEQTNG
jgi:hypothetical protein